MKYWNDLLISTCLECNGSGNFIKKNILLDLSIKTEVKIQSIQVEITIMINIVMTHGI